MIAAAATMGAGWVGPLAAETVSPADLDRHRARRGALLAAETACTGMRGRDAAYRERLTSTTGLVAAAAALPAIVTREDVDAPAATSSAGPPMVARIPGWLKVAYALFLAVLVPIWMAKNGLANFLWFSDIALLATGAALWLESARLASMMAVGVLLPETLWNLSFFGRLVTGHRVTDLAAYMFERGKSRLVRGLSLVMHVTLPLLLLYLVARLGYDELAWVWQTALACVVLPATYLLTDPAKNINWVFGPGSRPQHRVPPLVYLALVMVVFPVGVYLPTHLLLRRLF